MIRLLTIDVINAYITLTALSLSGGFQDPRLLLPGWIIIATVCPPSPPTLSSSNPAKLTASTPDSHSMLPHNTPKNQHPQRNIHLGKRLLDSKLHKHGDAPHPHATLPARLPRHAACHESSTDIWRGSPCCGAGKGNHRPRTSRALKYKSKIVYTS